MVLARNFGKPVSRAKLLTAVYGDDDKSRVGALGLCLEGARKSIKNSNLPYVLVKANAMITLAAKN
jgi:DNA-binding winged helix-turn-helix (wHTH) protein